MQKIIIYISFTAFIAFSCQNQVQQTQKPTPCSIMPGAKIYDVTKPETWGGDPVMAATPDDPSDDDAISINAALQAAADYLDSMKVIIGNYPGWEYPPRTVYQQIIYLPKGIYHLNQPVVFKPAMAYPERWGHKERFTWLAGSGKNNTILELKLGSRKLGSESNPKPFIQVVQYDPETYQGNDNFQLSVSDLSIQIPDDQPHAIGLSYGMANIGWVRNVNIKADGEAGHVGFALVQRNTGPGLIEELTVEGFDKGIEVIDPWGEAFTFVNITVKNQNQGGTGISIADKQIGIENLVMEQNQPNVVPVLLHNDRFYDTEHGGFPHLTLINASITSTVPSNSPAFVIEKGHTYLRSIKTKGYEQNLIKDHGIERRYNNGNIEGEYISVHGKTDDDKENVIVTTVETPEKSLQLPVKPTPRIDDEIFRKLNSGDYTIVSNDQLNNEKIKVNTSWVILDPSDDEDHTAILQAAFNSGARYVGLLNTGPFYVSEPIVVNALKECQVELVYGLMSKIIVRSKLSTEMATKNPGNNMLFKIEPGNSEILFFKGLKIMAEESQVADFTIFYNDFAGSAVFEDIMGLNAPSSYKNGKNAEKEDVFFNDVFFAYIGVKNNTMMNFKNQNVWARHFDIEYLMQQSSKLYEKYNVEHLIVYNTRPKIANSGGNLWIFSTKLGEHNGVFVQTSNGGKTEVLSTFFNSDRTLLSKTKYPAPNFLVKDADSEFSMTGQERIRTKFNDQGMAIRPLPHDNQFGIVIHPGNDTTVIEATSLPTYLKYEGYDPFNDTDVEVMDKKNHYRVGGLIRINNK